MGSTQNQQRFMGNFDELQYDFWPGQLWPHPVDGEHISGMDPTFRAPTPMA